MKTINLRQELKFIHSGKMNLANKNGLPFEMLNIAQVLMSNYANAETKKLKSFYTTVYWKTKKFMLNILKNPKC